MADFLTRMTQRTLGLLPVVQPIIASEFGSESMGADMPGGLTPIKPLPDQAAEESFEDREGVTEPIPPAPLHQAFMSRGVRIPTAPVLGVPPSVASPQEQPSTPKVQQTKPAPIRPHEVQPLRETIGGSLPSPLVPQPQNPTVRKPGREIPQAAELPGREQTSPLPPTKHVPDPYRVGAGLAPALGIEASTASNVSTTKPHSGQGK